MTEADRAERGYSRMTIAVHRIAPDGTRTEIVPSHVVTGSWVTISPLVLLSKCQCVRCIGPKAWKPSPGAVPSAASGTWRLPPSR